jgi:hypothetical protein
MHKKMIFSVPNTALYRKKWYPIMERSINRLLCNEGEQFKLGPQTMFSKNTIMAGKCKIHI